MAGKSKHTEVAADAEVAIDQSASPKTYDINRVTLKGNAVAQPELRYTSNGLPVARFRVATNFGGNPQFHICVAWREDAITATSSIKKGTRVQVDGRLQTRSWEAQDGTKRYVCEIVTQTLNIINTVKGLEA